MGYRNSLMVSARGNLEKKCGDDLNFSAPPNIVDVYENLELRPDGSVERNLYASLRDALFVGASTQILFYNVEGTTKGLRRR